MFLARLLILELMLDRLRLMRMFMRPLVKSLMNSLYIVNIDTGRGLAFIIICITVTF